MSKQADLRFLSYRDFIYTPIIAGMVWIVAAVVVWRVSIAFPHTEWALLALVFYLATVVEALLLLKLLRVFFPLREGIFTPDQHPREIYKWNLYGFLCLFHLNGLFLARVLPSPLQGVFYRLMGAKIGSGAIISGELTDPHLVEIGENTILGQGAQLSSHAIIRIGSGMALVIRKIRVDSNVIVGGRALIFPGARVGSGAMVNAMSLVGMGVEVGADEFWSGAPATFVRRLSAIQRSEAKGSRP